MSHLNIAQPLTLRCGLTLPNRVVKAAMAEGLADKDLLPGSKDCLNVYSEWSQGGWGLVISGTCHVSSLSLSWNDTNHSCLQAMCKLTLST